MAYLINLFTFFFALSTIAAGENITNPHLFCYLCESETTAACNIPAKVTALTSADCSALNYTDPRLPDDNKDLVMAVLSRSVDDKFQGGPLIQEILHDDTLHPNQVNYTYYCLTVRMQAGKKVSFSRNCAKFPSNVKDPCDYTRQEMADPVKVTFCSACTTHNCNGSASVAASILLIVVAVFSVSVLSKP